MTSSISGKAKLALFFAAALFLALGGWYAYERMGSGDILLEVAVPREEVQVGAPFDLEVRFTNNSPNVLTNVRFVLELPRNIIYADGSDGVTTRELGDVRSGGAHKESFRVIAVPGEEPDYKVRVRAFYSPASLVAEFRKSAEAEVRAGAPDFGLELNVSERVLPAEEFEAEVSYERRDGLLEEGEVELRLDFPERFRAASSNPEPVRDGNVWRLEDGEEGRGAVLVRGAVLPGGGERLQFTATLLFRILDKEFPFLTVKREVVVEPSPLTFEVVLAERGDVVRPGEELRYILQFRNNTTVALEALVVRAQLIGEMFDMNSLETDAAVDRTASTLTWDAGRKSELRRLGAGESGQVTFSVRVRDNFPTRQLNDKNFTLRVLGEIESPTVPYLIDASKTMNTDTHEAKVAGKLSVNARALFRDATTGILNGGPFPPRVGQPTNYTVHWEVANAGSDVDAVEVRAELPDGVRFTGVVGSNTETAPELEAESREVVWRAGKLAAATGMLGERPEAVFQVEAIPGASHVGNYMPILGITEILGTDEFTGETLTAQDGALTTRLPDDLTVNEGDGLVRE